MKTANDTARRPDLGILDHMLVLLDSGREPAHSRDFLAIALLVGASERFITGWISAN